MTAVDTFNALWVLMALPGFALLRRARRAWLDQGAFAALSASYITTFALLTPIGVLGYWLGWPIEVVSTALLAMMAIALLDLAWHWRELSLLPRPSLLGVIVLLMVMADYFAARRVGSYFIGDAHYHMGKIRTLMDYGLVNWDPYTPGRHFDLVYHSNLYHAAIAAWARLTELEGFDAWSRMLPWTKLLVVGSAEGLAYALFRSRALALGAAGAAVIAWFPLTMMPYPNQLAGLWLLPFALARGVDLLVHDRPVQSACGIAVAALVLAQVHGLYYAFACLLLGPALLAASLFALARRATRRSALVPALGLLALSVGLPWLATSALARVESNAAARAAAVASDEARIVVADTAPPVAPETEAAAGEGGDDTRVGNWRYRGFLLMKSGSLALDPGPLDLDNTRLHLLAAAVVLVLTRQRRIYALAAIVLTLALVLHAPAVCTLAVRAAGSPWMIRRLDVVVSFMALTFVPIALGVVLHERGWLRGPLPHLFFALAVGYAWLFGTDARAWTRAKYLVAVEQPDRQEIELRKQGRRAALLRATVPRGAVIATVPARTVEIPKICACFPLALASHEGSHGLLDMHERRRALARILATDTTNEDRASLMRRYGVRHIFLGVTRYSKTLRRLVAPLTVSAHQTRAGMLLELDPARVALPPPP